MSKCEHKTNYYVEDDAPIVLQPGGFVKYITYRCYKCKKMIYKDHPWENWKEVETSEAVGI